MPSLRAQNKMGRTKQTHKTAQKHSERQDATDIQLFSDCSMFICYL